MKQLNEKKTLHLIALYKIAKGIVLLCIAASLLFLDRRSDIVSALILWAEEELLLMHNSILRWLLNRFDLFLQAPSMGTAGLFALGYALVLLAEGIGVWKQQRWAELLMVWATASLIPLEVYHFIHKPSFVKVIVIAANSLIVVYLHRTLKRHRPPKV